MNNNQTLFSVKNIIIVSLCLLVVGFGTWYYINKKNKDKKIESTPVEVKKIDKLEELQSLSNSSAPVTTTQKEQISELNVLQKASKPVKTSNEDQIKELEALSRSSQ